MIVVVLELGKVAGNNCRAWRRRKARTVRSIKSSKWSSGTIQQALHFNAKIEAVNYPRTYP